MYAGNSVGAVSSQWRASEMYAQQPAAGCQPDTPWAQNLSLVPVPALFPHACATMSLLAARQRVCALGAGERCVRAWPMCQPMTLCAFLTFRNSAARRFSHGEATRRISHKCRFSQHSANTVICYSSVPHPAAAEWSEERWGRGRSLRPLRPQVLP
jgi:hypothetical protein